MAKRTPLGANIAKQDASKAADVARKIAGKAAPAPLPVSDAPEYETVSYNLPLDLIDLYRDLADLRHARDQAEKRALRRAIKDAKRAGQRAPTEPPMQARKSASAIVREALEAHRGAVEAEIEALNKG